MKAAKFIPNLLLAFGILVPIWALFMTFFLYIPEIQHMTVHKNDKAVLVEAEEIARNSAIAGALFAAVLAFSACTIWHRRKSKSAST